MRTRFKSSIVVVLAGLIPALIGGPVFALVMIWLGAAGYREYNDLAARINPGGFDPLALVGYAVIAALGFAALFEASVTALFAITALAVVAPLVLLVLLFLRPTRPGGFAAWSLSSIGSLYLGLPVFAAVTMRDRTGATDAPWLTDLAGRFSFGWEPAPQGFAWALTVILATWLGDSIAYVTGGTLGKRQLAPAISPNKSVEGAVGGLVGSMAVGAACFLSFGLGNWWLGVVAGIVIGLAGQFGDLAESILKRQAGVKDSGTMLPGHGGILDRIDALLFAFPAGFMLAAGFERIGV